jgi:hypothetical protein
MDASFIPVEVVPSETPFGLDQLRRSYKSALSASAAIAAAPAVGTADETFPNMFLMPVSTPESAESATRIDLLYMGCMNGAAGSPVLPAVRHSSSTAVQSATSRCALVGLNPFGDFTLTFYALTSEATFFSYNAAGTTGTVADPAGDPIIITLSQTDCAFLAGGTWEEFVANYFVIRVTDTIESVEVVPGKYWQNTERKIKYYAQPIFGS